MSKVTICRKIAFSSGHRYYIPTLSEDENRAIYGSLYSSAGHGHNFVLEAYLEGDIDARTGMVVNLKDVDTLLKEVVEPLDHQFLNTAIPVFRQTVPTTENIALYCYREIRKRFATDSIRLVKVRIHEGTDLWVDCEGE